MTTFKTNIVLGDRYRDDQTRIEGIAASIHFYQFACERVTLECIKADGDLQELTFDAPRLTSLTVQPLEEPKQKKGKTTKPGGPARAGETRATEGRLK